jgi:uncharacterized protein YyaL (SSP411 family)
MALEVYFAPAQYVVISGERQDHTLQVMRRAAEIAFMPHTSVVLNYLDTMPELKEILPNMTAGKEAIAGKTAAYICVDFSCRSPIFSATEFKEALTGLTGRQD